MDVLQSVTNITCDLIKMNKGIRPDEVVSFVQKIVPKINILAEESAKGFEFDFTKPSGCKKFAITMLDE